MNFLTRIGITSHATGQVVSGGNNSTQNLLRFLAVIIGPILSLVSIHILMYVFWEDFFIIWIKSFALWFVIGSLIICAFLNFIGVLNGFWYHLTVWVLPLLCIILYFYKNPIKSDSTVNSSGQQTEVQVPDTTYHNINGSLAMILLHGETFETTLKPNCEVVVRGTNFKQIITTDSLGIKNLNTVEGDASQIGAGQFVFIHTKGNGTPIVKTWRVF